MTDYLVELLKNELFITYDDETTNKRLERIVLNAIYTMNFKLGANIDYLSEGAEQNLFINYCVYAWNGCASDFDKNYFNEIQQMRIKYEVQNNNEED